MAYGPPGVPFQKMIQQFPLHIQKTHAKFSPFGAGSILSIVSSYKFVLPSFKPDNLFLQSANNLFLQS